ncbi:centromere protein N [Gadus chalcogrammus]|uniref:centromere protein N n=1 Tax=Gadus chalcogrammus TaxID=1042646 RepID=UPI0024C4CCC7|nr:centromere protein N [Gadus chalcogrammus]
MDDLRRHLLKRLIRTMPTQTLKTTLRLWDRLSVEQQESLDFTKPKYVLTERLLDLCEESGLGVKHITELEMVYVIDHPNQRQWHAYQLLEAADDALSVELSNFKEQFKAHLAELIRHVSIKIKKHTDEAVWIRIAWGDRSWRPNHLKPTYVVHHLQTPYVFITNSTSKTMPLLSQALVLATRYSSMKDAGLSGRNLTAIRGLLMKQFQQVFPSKHLQTLQGDNQTKPNPQMECEQDEQSEKRLQAACEAFGGGTLPELQKVTYTLETKFKDKTNQIMTEREQPFRCTVTFKSSNILESLRHSASTGITSTPLSPLLSSISQKGRNVFLITDKGKTEDQIGKKRGLRNLADDVFLKDTIEAAAWCQLQTFTDLVSLPMVIGMEGAEQQALLAELKSVDRSCPEESPNRIEPFQFSFNSKKDYEMFCVEMFDRRKLKVFASWE